MENRKMKSIKNVIIVLAIVLLLFLLLLSSSSSLFVLCFPVRARRIHSESVILIRIMSKQRGYLSKEINEEKNLIWENRVKDQYYSNDSIYKSTMVKIWRNERREATESQDRNDFLRRDCICKTTQRIILIRVEDKLLKAESVKQEEGYEKVSSINIILRRTLEAAVRRFIPTRTTTLRKRRREEEIGN